MATYAHVIVQAFMLFPLVAALVTVPYALYNYRRYGSALGLKTLIFYSFVLYMLCVAFLVILPLPSRESVAQLTTARWRLEPFAFVADIHKTVPGSLRDPANWGAILRSPGFLQVFCNICMTIPFGAYLRYYFGRPLGQTVALGFALTLFIELTQLTGLWFLYPRPYRLFEVDDLIANTLGAFLGYLLIGPLLRWLPTRDQLDHASYRRGQHVSLPRRALALAIDVAIVAVLAFVVQGLLHRLGLNLRTRIVFCACLALYFLLIPALSSGRTPGRAALRIRVLDTNGQPAPWYRCMLRSFILLGVLVGVPLAVFYGARSVPQVNTTDLELGPLTFSLPYILFFGLYGFLGLFLLIEAAMRQPLFYERLSQTRMESTLCQGAAPIPAVPDFPEGAHFQAGGEGEPAPRPHL